MPVYRLPSMEVIETNRVTPPSEVTPGYWLTWMYFHDFQTVIVREDMRVYDLFESFYSTSPAQWVKDYARLQARFICQV